MPFCPKCRFEYRPEIYICPDCNERLVTILPPEEATATENKEYKDWVTVSKLESFQFAEMIRERLEELNIPIVILSRASRYETTRIMGLSTINPLGGRYAILVPKEYVEEADLEGEAIFGEDWVKGKTI
jgi:hypothetical protein